MVASYKRDARLSMNDITFWFYSVEYNGLSWLSFMYFENLHALVSPGKYTVEMNCSDVDDFCEFGIANV